MPVARNTRLTILTVLTMLLLLVLLAGPATAQPVVQDGLVNVAIGDIAILNNVQALVAAQIVAALCADLDLAAAVLAVQEVDQGGDTLVCEAVGEIGDITVTQNNPGNRPSYGPARGPVVQDGLVNVAIGDIAILNNVQVVAAAQIVAAVCADLDLALAILAVQEVDQGGDTLVCEAVGEIGDITVTQNNPGRSRGR
jgi:hypothetical protein